MSSTDATISLHQIACSWLYARSKTIHTYLKAIKLGADGVRELKLTNMPLVNHALLTRVPGKPWYHLPKGYSDYSKVAYRRGDHWHEIVVGDHLMPIPKFNDTELGSNELGADLDAGKPIEGWYEQTPGQGGDFADLDYSGSDYNDNPVTETPAPICTEYGDFYCCGRGRYYRDTVAFDTKRGLLMCDEYFPHNEIYLVYVGIGNVDNMTEIPVGAQKTIEAYMDWWYAENSRNKSNAPYYRNLFYEIFKQYRHRKNPPSIADLQRVFGKRDIGRGTSWYAGYALVGCCDMGRTHEPPTCSVDTEPTKLIYKIGDPAIVLQTGNYDKVLPNGAAITIPEGYAYWLIFVDNTVLQPTDYTLSTDGRTMTPTITIENSNVYIYIIRDCNPHPTPTLSEILDENGDYFITEDNNQIILES